VWDYGAVNEVVAREALSPRAGEMARLELEGFSAAQVSSANAR
jgi:hypothetical protein